MSGRTSEELAERIHRVGALVGGFAHLFVEAIDEIDVAAVSAGRLIDAGAAGERVGALAAVQRILAAVAEQLIGVAEAVERVVAVIAVDFVGESVAGPVDVGGAGQGQVFDVGSEDKADRREHLVLPLVQGLGHLVKGIVDMILVVAGLAAHAVAAGSAVEQVVIRAALQRVAVRSAKELVIAVAALELVVPVEAEDDVVVRIAGDDIAVSVAQANPGRRALDQLQVLDTEGKREGLDIRPDLVVRVVGRSLPSARIGVVVVLIDDVVAVVDDIGVAALPSVHLVSVSAAVEMVVFAEADQDVEPLPAEDEVVLVVFADQSRQAGKKGARQGRAAIVPRSSRDNCHGPVLLLRGRPCPASKQCDDASAHAA